MRITNKSNKWLLSVALAVVAIMAMPVSSSAQEKGSAKGGAQQLMKPVKSMKEVENLKPGDQVAMACAKCKTVTLTEVTNSREHRQMMKQTGDEVTHTCAACGEAGFCCVLKKEETKTEKQN